MSASEPTRSRGLRLLLRLRPMEYLFVLFFAMLALLVWVVSEGRLAWYDVKEHLFVRFDDYGRIQLPFFSQQVILVVGALLLLICAVFALRWLRRIRGRGERLSDAIHPVRYVLQFARDFVPFVFAYLTYVLLRDLIPVVRESTVDGTLARLEYEWFGLYTFREVYLLLRCAAADYVLMFCYMTHYYLPFVVAARLYLLKDRRPFHDYMLALGITCCVGFLGFLLVPAVGPKYYFTDWYHTEGIQLAVATIDYYSRWTRDCFPSLHTAWAVIGVAYLYPRNRTAFGAYLLITIGILLATLYFGYHYVIDLPAGLLLALFGVLAARKLNRRWEGWLKAYGRGGVGKRAAL